MLWSNSAPIALWTASALAVFAVQARGEEPNTQQASAPAEADSAEAAVLELLGEKTSISLNEVPLIEAVRQFRESSKLNVLIDYQALDDVGLSDTVPVTLEVEDVSRRSALNLLLRDLELTWVVEGGALVVTTPEEAEKRPILRVYDVADLLRKEQREAIVSAFAPPFQNLADALHSNRRQQDVNELTRLIVHIVRPATWAHVGGDGSMEVIHGTLAVNHTRPIHEDLEALLAALREARRIVQEHPNEPPPQTSIAISDHGASAIRAALEQAITLDLAETPLNEALDQIEQQLGV